MVAPRRAKGQGVWGSRRPWHRFEHDATPARASVNAMRSPLGFLGSRFGTSPGAVTGRPPLPLRERVAKRAALSPGEGKAYFGHAFFEAAEASGLRSVRPHPSPLPQGER